MLGSAAEAENVVQDAYLRWSGTDHAAEFLTDRFG
jgi:DNA-directed RNA polymerase specialized sigma24 family protein